MTVGSLFAGIGGFDLGLERAGMTVKWQVEIDPFCNKVLAKHWPNVKRYGDIRNVGKHNLEPVDLICGGFPCQPFSVAGNQRGTEDERFLWPEMLRIIEEIKPSWIVGENVAGIVNMELDNVLFSLERLSYETQTFIIPACALDAKHRRDRVWIIANANSVRLSWSENKRQSISRFASLCPSKWNDFNPGNIRVAYGISNRMDRLKSLGNAVVPQIVEILGRAILEAESHL